MFRDTQILEPHPGPPKKGELGFDFLFVCLRRGFFNWQVLAHMTQI